MRIWPRRIVWQRTCAGVGDDVAAAGEAEVALQMLLVRRRRGESSSMPSTTSTMHSLHLPCFWQDVGTCDAQLARRSRRATRPAAASVDCPLMVSVTAMRDSQLYQSALASSSAFTASATSCAEPSRSSSSLHFHWAR